MHLKRRIGVQHGKKVEKENIAKVSTPMVTGIWVLVARIGVEHGKKDEKENIVNIQMC